MALTLGQALAEIFAKAGIEAAFVIPGSLMHFLDDLDSRKEFRLFTATHEDHLGFMAMGWYRASNKVPLVLATQGPGVTSLVNSVASAWRDQCPMVLVTAYESRQVGTSFQDTSGRGYTPSVRDILRPITAAQIRVNANNWHEELPRLICLLAELDAPILVEVDDTKATIPAGTPLIHEAEAQMDPPPEIDLEAVLRTSVKPLLKPVALLGQGARHLDYPALLDVLQALDVPVATTLGAHDLVPTSMAVSVGSVGFLGQPPATELLGRRCGQLIAIGTSMSRMTRAGWFEDFRARNPELLNLNLQPLDVPPDVRCREIKVDLKRCRLGRAGSNLGLPAPEPEHPLLKHFNGLFPSKVVSVEAFRRTLFLDHFFRKGDLLITSASHGSLGCSLPLACGSALARPEPHLVVCGDGGFLFTSTSLLTLRRYNLRVLVLVLVNGEFRTVAESQRRRLGRSICADLTLPDLVKFTRSCGVESRECRSNEDVIGLMDQFAQADGPMVGILEDSLIP